MKRQSISLKSQNNKLREYESKLQINQSKINKHETTINDLKKQMEEWDQKFADLTSEINRAREEAQKFLNTTKQSEKTCDEVQLNEGNVKSHLSHVTLPRKRQSTLEFDFPNKKSKGISNKEDITYLIDENITKNISKSITDKFIKPKPTFANALFKKTDFSSFLSSSIETLLKNPLTSIRSRKRKISEVTI